MKKILLVLEYVRQGYVKKDNNVDFWSSEEGKNYFNYFKEVGINKRNIEVAYFYPQIPEPKKVSNRGQVFSYKTPPKKEWEPLLHKLEEKIDAVQPDIIIPTGALGNSYFTGKSAVKDVRGKPTEFERNKNNYAVIPLYGPTAILVNANLANSMRSDVSLIGSFLVEGEKALEPKIGKYEAVTTIERVREIFNYLKTDKPVTAWDLETNTLEPNLKGAKALVASLSWEEGQGVTIYLEHKETPFTKEEVAEILSYLKEVLADETHIKVTHNGKYDMHFLMGVYNFTTFKNIRDTMVGYWLTVTQEKEDSFRLTDLTYYYTDMGGYDDALEDYKKKYISEFKEKEKERVAREKEEQQELKRAYAKEHGVTQKVATERLNLETPTVRKLVNEVDGSNFNFEWFPLDILYPYASGDTDATLRIYNKQMKVIEQNEKWNYLMTDFYPRLSASLATMQNNGLHFDRQYLEDSKEKYEAEIEKYSKLLQDDIHVQEVVDDWQAMYERGLEEFQLPPKERDQEIAKWKNKYKKKLEEGFKPSSSNDKQYLLYYKLGIRPPVEKKYLTSGAQDKNVNEDTVTWEDFKTNEETVQWIMSNHPEYEELCGTLLMWIKANTINNSFVTKYLEMVSRENSDGLVHPSFNPTGTATSRLSSSNPNAQQLPSNPSDIERIDYKFPFKRAINSIFENGVIVQADYSSLESHILGLVAQDDVITQGFIDGKDTHKETASIMNGIPYEDVDKVKRQQAKEITFGLIYGKGASSLAVDLKISTEEAEQLVDKYYESKPKVRDFIETTHAKAKRDGYVETLQGNRRNLKEIWNKRTEADALRKTVNTIVQGTGAYFTNLSVILIQDYIDLRNLKSKLIMTVHDSIVLDTPKEEYQEMAKVTKYIMENLPIEWTKYNLNGKEITYPIEADVEIGWNYKDAVGFDLESIKTFKSLKGYIKFEKDKAKFADYEADNRISKEQMKAGIQAVENSIEAYRVME